MHSLPYGGSTYSKTAVADPVFDRLITHGDGWRTFDDQGNDYADYMCGLGSVILGHRHPVVDEAIRRQLCSGTTLSLASAIEHEAAERLLKHFPDGCMMQWTVNGSDATEGACRLARAVTGRDIILMAENGYHGFHDWCLSETERGFGIPPLYKAPNHFPNVHRFSRLDHLTNSLVGWAKAGQFVAAVIVEPDLLPWLKDIRAWCTSHGALMIVDELNTWQRYPEWTATAHYGVTPDLWCLGKSLANGLPCSAIVGPQDILKRFTPYQSARGGSVLSEKQSTTPYMNAFFSCTWAGHPLSMAAVIATLDVLERENGCRRLWDQARELPGLIGDTGPLSTGLLPFNRVFGPTKTMRAWRQLMLEHGVLIYSAHNLSLAHDTNAMTRLKEAWKNSVRLLPERLDAMPKSEDKETSIMRR